MIIEEDRIKGDVKARKEKKIVREGEREKETPSSLLPLKTFFPRRRPATLSLQKKKLPKIIFFF
jgi:hypothetical protein